MSSKRRKRTALRARHSLARGIVVIDTETTGLGPDAEIIEVTCVDGFIQVTLGEGGGPTGAGQT